MGTAGRLITLALVIGGCAVGPTTSPRPMAAPSPRSAPSSLTTQGLLDSLTSTQLGPPPARLEVDTSSAALTWLTVLGDSQLVALVRTALEQNRDLQLATARVREYRAEIGVARGDLFPQLTANGTRSTNRVAFGAFPPAQFDVVRATADLQWELDFWGRIRRQTEAARFDWRAQEDDRRAVVLSLVSDVVTAYLELRELDEDVRVTEQTLQSRQATLRLARQRFQQGVISELDVRQFEADAATPAARVADFAKQRIAKEHQLSLLLGQPPGPITRTGALGDAVRPVTPPDSVPSELLGRRPDVMRSLHEWSASAARVGVAIANRLPAVTIVGSYGRQQPSFDHLFGRAGEIYTAQAGISIPLFTGGRLASDQRAAAARADQARIRYEQTLLTALQEASDGLSNLRLSRDGLAAAAARTGALRRGLTLAQERYRAGVSSYLEVLDAERTLFDAELALVQARRQYLAAVVQLYKALGGWWP
jgi:multidrug efflux system outer membrane protein